MTDKQFQKVLDRVASAKAKYDEALRIADSEYQRRFGTDPYSVDDDFWIDSFCQVGNGATVEQVTKHAKYFITN